MFADTLPLAQVAPPVALSCIAVSSLVISDRRESRIGRYLFKPVAAAAFIWLAFVLDATASEYGRWMLAALALCMAGDLLLMPDSKSYFLAGLGAFLCGHLLFAVAFFHIGGNYLIAAASVVPAILLLALTARWLAPHVSADMKIPVALYMLVISAMLVCAGLTVGHPAAGFILIGAWAFAASDLAVARRQFIDPSRMNALWGTPLYFAAQMILACSIALA